MQQSDQQPQEPSQYHHLHHPQEQQHHQQTARSQLQLNPRANVFILVNLGCEMLYVIDQRLKAQQIAVDKSIQVVHDITAVLLEPKYIDSLIVGSTHATAQLLTADHCKFMLNDIATCSLMRLDENSMGKLWNLMTMVYKWQLYVSRHQHHLLEITFRHLDSIAKLYPEEKRHMLIDFTKNTLLDFWNSLGDDEQHAIYLTNKAWLECFQTKISLLIRLGFQALDGTFIRQPDVGYYKAFVQSAGVNIYTKSIEVAEEEKAALSEAGGPRRVDPLAELLHISTGTGRQETAPEAVHSANALEEGGDNDFERQLQACNMLFDELSSTGDASAERPLKGPCLDLSLFPDSSTSPFDDGADEFVHLKATYSRNANDSFLAASSSQADAGGGGASALLDKDLLELYSKLE